MSSGTSWLSKVGAFLGKIIGIAQKIEPTAVNITEALLPQFAPLIGTADTLFQAIIKEVVAVEATFAAAGNAAGTGAQKLAAALGTVGPIVDNWVASAFPGAAKVSDIAKTGLINSVVTLLNEIEGKPPVA